MLPKVSIIIPSYKPEHFEICLRSALGQTYSNTEILVSDNCPTEEIKNICMKYSGLGVIYQKSNIFREENLKAALAGAKGEYIKPLFDDDLLHPFCIERMISAIHVDSDVELVFSASQIINADNELVQVRRPFQSHGTLLGAEVHRRVTLGMENFIGEFSTVLFRRKKLWKIGINNLFKMGSHDFTLGLADLIAYLNLSAEGKIFYVDEELSYFRKDLRISSNSNPTVNPFFGNCFSDYIDLLRVSLESGIITNTEYNSMEGKVNSLSESYSKFFPQIDSARDRYMLQKL